MEPEESAEAALHRELQEELGCSVCVVQALPSYVHDYDWGSIELIPFVCELAVESQEPHPHEHSAIAWVKIDDLTGYDLAPADVPLLKRLV